MMGFERYGYGGFRPGMVGFGIGGMIMGLFGLILFIMLVVWIVRMVTWRRHGMGYPMGYRRWMYGMRDDYGMMHGGQDEALDILRKRFASGDVTKEEYEERVKILNGEKQP